MAVDGTARIARGSGAARRRVRGARAPIARTGRPPARLTLTPRRRGPLPRGRRGPIVGDGDVAARRSLAVAGEGRGEAVPPSYGSASATGRVRRAGDEHDRRAEERVVRDRRSDPSVELAQRPLRVDRRPEPGEGHRAGPPRSSPEARSRGQRSSASVTGAAAGRVRRRRSSRSRAIGTVDARRVFSSNTPR